MKQTPFAKQRQVTSLLWKTHKVLEQLEVLRSAETSDRVPALDGGEALSVASRVASLCTKSDISEGSRVLVHGRVSEANDRLASVETLFVDAVQDGGEDGRRHGRATNAAKLALESNDAVVTNG